MYTNLFIVKKDKQCYKVIKVVFNFIFIEENTS